MEISHYNINKYCTNIVTHKTNNIDMQKETTKIIASLTTTYKILQYSLLPTLWVLCGLTSNQIIGFYMFNP